MFVCTECGSSSSGPGACPTDGVQFLPIGEDLLLGTTIGAYRVARLLGVGGMGRVYKGVHPSIGSRVAIKVLSRECSDRRDLVDRFFAEARAVNLIRHESIVNVLDLATLPDGRPYIIMEYLDGAPLQTIIEAATGAQRRLPIGGVARLCAEVLDALQAAHDKGVIHRDLKPDNIYVTPSGRPKVLDFGIAKLSDNAVNSSTRTGSLLGTPHYMSPEQASGLPVDHRTDVYAMGIILFESLTGQKPFVADVLFNLLRMHVETPPPSPRALRPEIPLDVENVILCALAKKPEERFANARAMSMALQHATQSLPQSEWAPVTGGLDLAATQPRAWAPPSPQSWGGGSTPSGAPPIAPSNQFQQGSTVSASSGQVLRLEEKKSGSKSGLLIGLGAIGLVAAGVVIAVVASHGSSDAPTVAAVEEPAKTIEPAKADEPTPPAKDDDDEKPSKESDDEGSDPLANLDDTEMNMVIDQMTTALKADSAHMTPEMKKLLPELEALKKVPAAQRMAKLEELSQKFANVDANVGGGPAKIAEDDTQPSPPVPSGPNANGWFDRHVLQPPMKMDKVDTSKFIAWAIAEAKATVPDARLTRIDINNVNAQGIADLTLPNGVFDSDITLRFISPSFPKRNAAVPKGVNVKQKECAFYIIAKANEVEMYDTSSGGCDDKPVAEPKCSLAQVMKKLIAKHPGVADYVAQVGYWTNPVLKTTAWSVDVKDGDKTKVDERITDDCR